MFQLQLFFLLHCDEWDRVVALPRHKFVTGTTLLQLKMTQWFVTRVTWRVPHVVQELPTLPEHISSPPDIVGSCCLIFSFLCMQCFLERCLFFSFFFFCPLCCLSSLDLRLLITPLVSSNVS